MQKRIHVSKNSNLVFENKGNQDIGPKPKGLWYSFNDEWISWCNGENFRLESTKHKFLLELDLDKIYQISNNKQFIDFFEKYKDLVDWKKKILPNTKHIDFMDINWGKVSEEYYGIEINPYMYEFRFSHMWYCGWDVSSGCVWNKDAVRSITLIEDNNYLEKTKKNYGTIVE